MRSYRRFDIGGLYDVPRENNRASYFYYFSYRGRLVTGVTTIPIALNPKPSWRLIKSSDDATKIKLPEHRPFGFEPGPEVTNLYFPHWSLAALFAIVPTWWLTAIVRARRKVPPGCCGKCGYDLRASPDRCPECGTAPIAAN